MLCAALLAAGDLLCAAGSQWKPVSRGSRATREYMSLLRTRMRSCRSARIRSSMPWNAPGSSCARTPRAGSSYSQEILQLESRIFEIRNAKGRLIDTYQHHRAGVGARQPERRGAAAGGACRGKSCRRRSPTRSRCAIWLTTPISASSCPEADYAALRKAQRLELRRRGLCEPLFCQLRDDLPNWPKPTPRRRPRPMRCEIYDRYNTLQGFNRVLADSLAEAWNYIADNKGLCLWLSDGQTGAGCHPGA